MMPNARRIGEITAPLFERAARLRAFQDRLNGLSTAEDRKQKIIEAHCAGVLDADATTLLIQVYGLECA